MLYMLLYLKSDLLNWLSLFGLSELYLDKSESVGKIIYIILMGAYTMKIHIIGGSGTGKTYLANTLSKKLNIPHYDLDDLFWDNSSAQYGTKMCIEKRNQMLLNILENNEWILEGVFYSWVNESFEKSDLILVLDIPKHVYKRRIICRFVKRKLGIERGKKETLKTLRDLLVWTDKFQKENLIDIYSILNKYKDKTVILKSVKEINNYMKCNGI